MLEIKVILHSAISGRSREIANMIIFNSGGTVLRGQYGARVYRAGSGYWRGSKPLKELPPGSIKDYPRKRLHVWNLVVRSLLALGYK